MKKFYRNWISTFTGLDVFITVTLKQALTNQEGGRSAITPEEIRRTATLLRNRVTRKVCGRNKTMPFLVFQEGGKDYKRFHLHILTATPDWMNFEDFCSLVRLKADSLDWVYDQVVFRPIKEGTYSRLVRYSFKEGIDAFLPEASSLP